MGIPIKQIQFRKDSQRKSAKRHKKKTATLFKPLRN